VVLVADRAVAAKKIVFLRGLENLVTKMTGQR